ncbi:uncharacterized protein EAE97_000280 [Botrytis byssoidea]|uniref:Secreted protein n=1 Tax=Botrytis byssoidea TaxID=139641 RepID=A0A9P5IV22_9HELO|nr:uncharacterized protein EAE97_000280 [Botrytis byssoidea]KAF7955021.1 hypothetical protein EAE97_000280 [Botrytis byssoidea]
MGIGDRFWCELFTLYTLCLGCLAAAQREVVSSPSALRENLKCLFTWDECEVCRLYELVFANG